MKFKLNPYDICDSLMKKRNSVISILNKLFFKVIDRIREREREKKTSLTD